MSNFSIIENDGVLLVDSRLIAEGLGIQHNSFISTIRSYENLIEQEFGILRFEIEVLSGVGQPQRYCLLNENQATFLMTLSRNTPEVVRCKLDLVKAFSNARDLLKRRDQVQDTRIPYWYQRMRLAMSDLSKPLPDGYFCIYLRMMDLFSQLEVRFNYIFPDRSPQTDKVMIPDISIGKMFNKFLRSTEEIPSLARQDFLGSTMPVDFRFGGSHVNELKKYNHVYPKSSHGDTNIHEANAYPIKYSSIFDYYLTEGWIPDRSWDYLKERDIEGVEYLQAQINQLSPEEKQVIDITLVGKFLRNMLPGN